MDMSSSSSSSSSAACKISMLWNWYTIDSCFIARSWHNRTRGMFIGSCIGCALLVISAQWLHRIGREYDTALVKRKTRARSSFKQNSEQDLNTEYSEESYTYAQSSFLPILDTLSHNWILNFLSGNQTPDEVYPNLIDHILRSLLFTVQWTVSYIIMLLFMYYNGWIIISCIIGAFVGRLIFNYEPLATNCGLSYDKQTNDRKCCM